MNSIVIYETEHESHMDPGKVNVLVHRVLVGEGNVRDLEREYLLYIRTLIGPPPPNNVRRIYTLPDLKRVEDIDPEAEKLYRAWKVKLREHTHSLKFAKWLITNKQWTEIEDPVAYPKR